LLPRQELAADPLGILRPSTKLQHTLPLASAYAAVVDAAAAQRGSGGEQAAALERQRKRVDDQHHEPKCGDSPLSRPAAISPTQVLWNSARKCAAIDWMQCCLFASQCGREHDVQQ